jgi:peptidoglycan hydrolase-like protein with peptidoglycan-binding domain
VSGGSATPYRLLELGAPRDGVQRNEAVLGFEDLETHHPGSNRHARMRDGVIVDGERGRIHAFIGGGFQEIEIARPGRAQGLKPDQVLLKKDFILEDPRAAAIGRDPRAVDVPSPVAGYVGRVSERHGLVDILDRQDGVVIARIRHMRPLAVTEGEQVVYGQSLGTQSNQLTVGKHVHIEMDTRYYRSFANYVDDLASGRLPVDAVHRAGIEARPPAEDGTNRLGETSDRIATVQRALAADGYRATGDRPITIDGVYRLDMQGALLAFQQDHRIPRTGDVDPATVQVALRVNLDRPLGPLGPLGLAPPASVPAIDVLPSAMRELELGLDPRFTPRAGQPAPDAGHPADPARTRREPREHAHPFHDPAPMLERARTPDDPGHPDHALLERIRDGVRALDAGAGKRWDADSERLSAGLLVCARAAGFDAGDALHVATSRATDVAGGGEFVFLVRHGPTASPDPAANLARLRVTDALSTPVEQHYAQLERFEPQRDPAFAATRAPAVEPARHNAPGLG